MGGPPVLPTVKISLGEQITISISPEIVGGDGGADVGYAGEGRGGDDRGGGGARAEEAAEGVCAGGRGGG